MTAMVMASVVLGADADPYEIIGDRIIFCCPPPISHNAGVLHKHFHFWVRERLQENKEENAESITGGDNETDWAHAPVTVQNGLTYLVTIPLHSGTVGQVESSSAVGDIVVFVLDKCDSDSSRMSGLNQRSCSVPTNHTYIS